MKRLSVALGIVVALASRAALACPACLASSKNLQFLKLGSLFLLLPFAMVGLVLYVLRHAPGAVEARRVAASRQKQG